MDNAPKLAFAIPYYSGKQLLAAAIESVRRQANPSWSLLICDDSPTDEGISELVAQLGDARIRYRRNAATLGLAGNWNMCLAEADGDLVTLLHGDDELLENYCDLMLAAAAEYPDAAGWYCNARIIDSQGRKAFSPPDLVKRVLQPRSTDTVRLAGHEAVSRLLRGNFIMCPTMCFKRSRLGQRRFDSRWRFVVDLDLFVRLLIDGETLIGIPQTAYAYRRHSGSVTSQQTASLQRFVEEIEFYDHMAKLGAERGWPDVEAAASKKRIIRLNLGWCILQDLVTGRWLAAKSKLGRLSQIQARTP